VTARHYSTPALLWRWVVRHRAIMAVAITAAAALAVTGVVSFRRVMTQRNRAETQMHIAQDRSEELIFRQAENLLERDPTAALAYLKSYPAGGARATELGGMIDQAVAAGVARHVLRHQGWVMRVAFAKDGQLVTTDAHGNLTRWDVTTGKGHIVLRHGGDVHGYLSRDGSLLAVVYPDGRVELVPTDGTPARRLAGLESAAGVQVVFSADSRRALGMSTGHLRVWDAETGKVLLAVDDEPAEVGNLSADGSRVYLVRESGEIVERRVGGGAQPRTVTRLEQPAVSVRSSPDGSQLFIEDFARGLALIDVATGKRHPLGRHSISGGDGETVQWSHVGDRLAVAADDSTILLYKLPGGEETVLRGHGDPVYQVAFSRDDTRLYSSSDDSTARIWNLISGETQVLRGHLDDVSGLAISPDGRWLATSSFDNTARVWPLEAGSARVLPGHIIDAAAIGFAAGGRRLLIGNRDGQGESFDLATDASIQFQLERSKNGTAPALGKDLVIAGDARGGATLYEVATGDERPLPLENTEPVLAVAISDDDERAITVDESGALLLWNLGAGTARSVPVGRAPGRVRFLPGRHDALLAGVGLLEIWDVDHDRRVARAELPIAQSSHRPDEIAISPDGRMIASQEGGAAVVLWNPKDNRVSVVSANQVESFALSPDGARVAFALGSRKVDLWEAASGTIRTVILHGDLVHQVAWSPDGRMLASCSFDRTVRLWTGGEQPVRVLRGHGADVTAIAFSPDGKTLASVGSDGTVRLWPVTALPDARPSAVPARLLAATTAVIDREGHPLTPGH